MQSNLITIVKGPDLLFIKTFEIASVANASKAMSLNALTLL